MKKRRCWLTAPSRRSERRRGPDVEQPHCAYVGRTGDAISRAERALMLSPQDPLLFRYEHFLSIAHYAADDFEQAAHWGPVRGSATRIIRPICGSPSAIVGGVGPHRGGATPGRTTSHLQPEFRAAAVIKRNTFRQAAQREQLARLLSTAGLP